MAQGSGGNFREMGNQLVAKVRAWLEPRLQGVLHGPEVGPERAQQASSQAVEPEPTEAAREERGRRDAGVAEDAQQLDERATALTGQPTIETVESGEEVVTATESDQPSQPSQTGQPAASDVSGNQHRLAAEPGTDADVAAAAATQPATGADEEERADTLAANQHDVDSVEPPLDTTRAEDVQTSAAEAQAADAAASREERRAWDIDDAAEPAHTAGGGATGLPPRSLRVSMRPKRTFRRTPRRGARGRRSTATRAMTR
jgi:hypothetical protein